MKLTLLEMVQDILNDMDADEVNDIDDTVESQQVAQVIKTCYFEIIGTRNWPHLKKLLQLEAIGDLTKPNYLKIPDTVKELEMIRYESQKITDSKIYVKDIHFKHPDDFLRYVSMRDSSLSTITTVTDFSGVKLFIYNERAPEYWTTFDDEYIVFDSYDSAIDDTLKTSKNSCIAYVNPTWERSNDAIPDLPIEAFPAFLEEAKSTAFLALKQMANQKAEQKAGRGQRWLSRKAWKADGGIRYSDYGRKSRR